MRLAAVCLAMIFTAAPVGAYAGDCLATAVTQADMNQCMAQSGSKADRHLNETYQALLGKVSKGGAEQLRRAQRAWVAWRDAQCDFDTLGSAGGSIHASMVADCAERLTEAQTRHLDAQLHCQEGDLSCGGQ